LHASQFPFLLKEAEGKRLLEFHIPRKNPLCALARAGQRLLAICNGPDHYISASWYHTPELPTWNFVTVQIQGRPTLIDDTAKRQHLEALCQHNEQKYAGKPWTLSANESLLTPLFDQIDAFQMPIETLEPQWKLSQNEPKEERERLIWSLKQTANAQAREVAEWMERE
jgi:transcriptional regulator